MMFLAIGIFVAKLLQILFSSLSITNMRIVAKKGALSLKVIEIPIDKICAVTISASFFGKIFGSYSLKFTAQGDAKIRNFPAMKNGPQLKNILFDAINKHTDEAREAQAQAIAKHILIKQQ